MENTLFYYEFKDNSNELLQYFNCKLKLNVGPFPPDYKFDIIEVDVEQSILELFKNEDDITASFDLLPEMIDQIIKEK